MFIMTDESGRLVGAGTSGESLIKSLEVYPTLAKASTSGRRVVFSRQKPKTPHKLHPWRYKEGKPQSPRLEDLVKSLSAIARGEPMLKSFCAQRFAPDGTMGAAMQKLPVEHRQPHVVRELRAMGVSI